MVKCSDTDEKDGDAEDAASVDNDVDFEALLFGTPGEKYDGEVYEAEPLGADESDGEGDDEEVADASTLFVAALFIL